MIQRILCFALSCFVLPLYAQQDRLQITPKGENIVLKPELRVSAGVSIPLGKYAALDTTMTAAIGCAKIGGFADIVLGHRFRRASLWSVQIALGYMQHGYNVDSLKARYQLSSFTCKPWMAAHLLPGIAFQGGKRFKFEIQAHAGLVFFNGRNATRADYVDDKTDYYRQREWKFNWRLAGGLRGGLLLGYMVNDRLLLFAQGWLQYAWGSRLGTLNQSFYDLDNQGIPEETPYLTKNIRITQSALFLTINAGIGIRYQLYNFLNEPKLPSDNQ